MRAVRRAVTGRPGSGVHPTHISVGTGAVRRAGPAISVRWGARIGRRGDERPARPVGGGRGRALRRPLKPDGRRRCAPQSRAAGNVRPRSRERPWGSGCRLGRGGGSPVTDGCLPDPLGPRVGLEASRAGRRRNRQTHGATTGRFGSIRPRATLSGWSRCPSARAHRWGCSSAGRAPRSHRGGQGFESPHLHQFPCRTVGRLGRW